ncbi:MAG TPA: O-antigen ligase family protein [Sphingomicrobium sp.]|nr:O-antigen ligase family protein [Sphingomicrobium sp.]
MSAAMRSAVVPAYIVLCILLGGSAQGHWGNAALQILAIAIIGWSLLGREPLRLSGPAKGLFAIAGLTIALLVVQLVPLPPGLWTAIPGRGAIAEGYRLLGQPLPWLPISLTPYDTAATALTLLAPLAVLVAMLVAGTYRASWIVLAVLIGTIAAVLLGALQVASPDPANSPWYLYRRTNHGAATGFFANSNHMATLLVVTVPLLIALIAELRRRSKDPRAASAVLLLAVAGLLVLLVGIFLNGSLAVLLLGLPVLVVSGTMLTPEGTRLRGPVIAVALVAIAAMMAVYTTPLQDKLLSSNQTSFESRQMIWSNSIPAIGDNLALGSGVGSFPRVYRQYEDHSEVTRTFANHAHNDYLEIALETGGPGILLLVAFFIWWGSRVVPIWRTATVDRYAVAASIASAGILVHSLVDYPLRTAALSAIMAACLALIARPRMRDNSDREDLWPTTRHLAI